MHITLPKLSFKLLTSFGALALMIVAPAVSHATVVYSNLGAGSSSDINGNEVGNDGVPGDNLAQGDTFTPGANYTLTGIQIALSCWGTCANNYTVEIVADSAGLPDTTTVLFSAVELGTALGAPSTSSLVSIPTTISVLSGVAYWLVVLPDAGGTDNIQWNWNTQSDASTQATAGAGGGPGDSWFVLGQTPGAYEIDGTLATTAAPEPGTIGMMLGGGLLLGFLRKVRR